MRRASTRCCHDQHGDMWSTTGVAQGSEVRRDARARNQKHRSDEGDAIWDGDARDENGASGGLIGGCFLVFLPESKTSLYVPSMMSSATGQASFTGRPSLSPLHPSIIKTRLERLSNHARVFSVSTAYISWHQMGTACHSLATRHLSLTA
jgi:hypothetical protein